MNHDELRLTVLRKAKNLKNQRSLADELDLSVGKINYVIQELVKKGFLKVERFTQSANKKRYCYLLTARGVSEKFRLTEAFIAKKKNEYEDLKRELEMMKRDA
jgi:EPS-associated MarR family transcriptional regulator